MNEDAIMALHRLAGMIVCRHREHAEMVERDLNTVLRALRGEHD